MGAPPTSILPDGKPRYTAPTITDSKTGKAVTESAVIAEYLDVEYPDTPKLFPPGPAAAIHIFEQIWEEQVMTHLRPLMIPAVYANVNPESKTFVREVSEKMFNCRFEDFMPEEKRPEQLLKLKAGLSKIAAYLDQNGKEKSFFLGYTFSYADCIVAGPLISAKKLLDHAEWGQIESFDGGRWRNIVEHCEKFSGSL